MNGDVEWWAYQRRLVEKALNDFDRGEIQLQTLAADLMSISDAMDERGSEAMSPIAAGLSDAPEEWLENFRSAAFGIEVIFAVAADKGVDVLPPDEVDAVDREIDQVEFLVGQLPV
ncbi:hypothetical protein [Streptomyces fractus]|uniref:hypothetical protein n=1 Tax=Streptomyces fractus TaxID=641806 RepID=UPI003CED4537